jgi:hypothetical protein
VEGRISRREADLFQVIPDRLGLFRDFWIIKFAELVDGFSESAGSQLLDREVHLS